MNRFKIEHSLNPRRGRSLGTALAALISAVLLLGSAAPTNAATGTVGTYSELGASCFFKVVTPGYWGPNGWVDATYTSQIRAQAPFILAAPVPLDPGIVWVGPGLHRQWVGFRTNLYVSGDQGKTWRYTGDSSPWLLNIALWPHGGAPVDEMYGNSTWWNADTKAYGYSGETTFDTTNPGLYRITYQFYWYADAKVGPGSDAAWANAYSWYDKGSALEMINANYCAGGSAFPNGN